MFYNTNLPPHLRVLKDEIEGYARDYGLDFYETIFEVVDADDLNEIAAYGGFPTRYPHWSFGMSYEELKKGYDYGLSKIYEMVINNDPCYAYLMRCNHTVDQKLVMAHVYGHCLAPDTLIETRTGIKPITEVSVGDEVLTHTGVYRKVTARARRWYSGLIRAVRVTGSNQTVRITDEHPVYTVRAESCTLANRATVRCRESCQSQHKCGSPKPYENYAAEWLPAGKLREGDFVCFPKRKPIPSLASEAIEIPFEKILRRQLRRGAHQIPVTEELAKLIGFFIAEGNAQPRGLVGFGFHRKETELHDEVSRLIRKVYGLKVGRDDSKTAQAVTIRFNNLEIAAWLRETVGIRGNSKRIPDFLYEHPDLRIPMACLDAIYAGDGTYAVSPTRKSGQLSVSTISAELAYQLRHLALRADLKTNLYTRKRPNRQLVHELIWSGSSAHRLSQRLFGEDVIEGNRSFERGWIDDDFAYQQVKRIQLEPYDGYVYNFSVEEDESYTLAAGFVVHNCDFFKNNAFFGHTNRKMMDEIANHGARIRRYEERFGVDEVESFVDRCMSLDDLIDIHSTAIKRRDDHSRYDFTEKSEEAPVTKFKSKSYMDEYINPRHEYNAEEEKKKNSSAVDLNFPERPEKDVLLFLIEHAPLKAWQRDVLAIIRDEAYYFTPQGQTKIINEGWASYWHSTIMTQKVLLPSEVIDYADHHSGTMATSGKRLNPYKLGIELLRDIEFRWNTGRFGPEYEDCDDLDKKRSWNQNLGLGRQKIFEVRRVHNDITFIDTFLTPEFCIEHKLFSFAYADQTKQYLVESREFEMVKQRLLFSLTNFGKPWIYVVNGNHRNRGELLLKHEYNGIELKLAHAQDTLSNIQSMWTRPVHIETVCDNKPTLLSFDGSEHTKKIIGETDDKRPAPPKTK